MTKAAATKVTAPAFEGRWWQRGIREALLLLCAGAAVLLLISLLSYDRADPGFGESGSWGRPENLGGWVGAWLADLVLSSLGWLAYVLPWLLLGAGVQLYRQDGAVLRWPWLRCVPRAHAKRPLRRGAAVP